MRTEQELMTGWYFTGKDGVPVAVELPHTWNAQDGQDGGNDYYRGICTYETEFACPEFDRENQCVYLQFEGVNASAKVYINGQEVMCHDGGYSTFRGDITAFLQAENALKVEVDNSVNDRVYPQKADFTFYGGIYRKVSLLVVNKFHFDLDYFGGKGIMVTPEINGANANIKVETFVTNLTDSQKIVYTVYDKEEKAIATVSGGKEAEILIENVHLWHGRRDPYL